MKAIVKWLIILCVMGCDLTTVYAASGVTAPVSDADNQQKMYLGLLMGVGTQRRDRDFGWRVDMGYNFNQYWTLETGYTVYPDTTHTKSGITTDYEKYSVELMGKLNIPLGTWPLYGADGKTQFYTKLGLAFSHTEQEKHLATGIDDKDVRRADVALGIGVSYQVTPAFSVDLSTQALWHLPLTDSSLTAIGLTYSFT